MTLGLPTSSFQGTLGRATVNGPVYKALRRQGRLVVRAEGPRHHRPRTTKSSRTSGHQGTPVSAAARGPVRAAADTASPLDCPREPLGCQATFWPPRRLGNALEQRLRLPSPIRPPRGTVLSTGVAALCPCYYFLSPLHPLTGALRIADAPACRRLCRSCRFLWRLCRAALGFLSTWESACDGERGCSAYICPSAIFPSSLQGVAM